MPSRLLNHSRRTTGPARRRRRAFTLVEIIVVIVIIAVLATIIAPRIFSRVGQSKQAVGQANAASLATAFKTMMADCGWSRVPESVTIDALWEKPSDATGWKGPYVENREALLDPWGKPYVLAVPPKKNVDFDIVSYGADGTEGGADENEDIRKP